MFAALSARARARQNDDAIPAWQSKAKSRKRARDDGDKSANDDDSRASETGTIYLTVEWLSRTRGRSNELFAETPQCADVAIEVSESVTGRALVEACVQLPPGATDAMSLLQWGNLKLDDGILHGQEDGGWSLDVRATPPVRLKLTVPNGTLLKHPALVKETRGKQSVPKELLSDANALKEDLNDPSSVSKETDKAEVVERSRRALHPGRTDDHGIAALLNDHKVFYGKKANMGSFVDVGSGCGSLAAGLARAFPGINVCGIECQDELINQSRLRFRDVDFIHDQAENVLHTCRSAKVVLATTQNFDYETTNYILRVAAELPLLTHLIINEPYLCRPACRTNLKLCCCFEPLETREIKTHWGNSTLSFTIYKRHVRWPYGANALPRGADTAVALMEGNVNEMFLKKTDNSQENSVD